MHARLHWIEAHHARLIWLAVLAGAVLRFQGLGWDGWHQFHPDERNLADAARALSFPDALLPGFHAYNGLALYLPRALAWAVFGPAPDMAVVTWAARFLSAGFGSLTVLIGARVALDLGGALAGVAAALLLATSATLIQWAHFGTTESAMMLAVAVLWWLTLRHLAMRDPPLRAALLSGLVLGLALGMKTSAAAFSIIPLAGLGLMWRVHGRPLPAALFAGVAVAAIVFLAKTPSILLATRDYLAVMAFEADVVSGAADVFWTLQFDGARNGLFEIRTLWQMLDGGILVLALIGAGLALRNRRAACLPALVFVIAYCGIVFFWHAKFARYLAPVLPVLLVFAGLAVSDIARARWQSVRVATLAAMALSGVTGLAMAASFQSTDPRVAASAYLRHQIRAGETILREPVDIGAPLFDWPSLEHLPLLEPQSPGKLADIAEKVAKALWLVINSRRHWAVLPRIQRYAPQLCGFYAALAAGDFGLAEVARFHRAEPLRGLFRPGLTAEETRVVFDRPQVILYRRVARTPADAIAAAIAAQGNDCRQVQP